jgi:hypothetical protein
MSNYDLACNPNTPQYIKTYLKIKRYGRMMANNKYSGNYKTRDEAKDSAYLYAEYLNKK